MSYIIVIFASRKQGTSPASFKHHYETSHVPLLKSITGDLFPKSHTRYYIERTPTADASTDTTNNAYPATVLAGGQEAFDYDAYAELVFTDAEAFGKFYGCVTDPEAAKRIADDEAQFLDRARMTIAVVDEKSATS